jgi:DNA-binding response OmpR family regulator
MTIGSGRTALIVEDDPAVRKLIESILRLQGFAVLPAGTAAEAIALSGGYRGTLDLLITDFGLGEMNGLDLAARISGTRPGLRVLLVSGHTELPIPEGLRAALRTGFLAKPFTMDALVARVAEMLEDGPGAPKQAV